jgi:uncharacterized protein
MRARPAPVFAPVSRPGRTMGTPAAPTTAARGRLGVGSLLPVIAALGLAVVGCASHSETTLPVRNALDAGDPARAAALLSKQMGAPSSETLPPNLDGDKALLLLDRATVHQAMAAFPQSKTDYEAADKAIDLLDLSANAGDSLAKYMYSDSAGRYRAPPYEKLLINTFNLLNYLETGDDPGGKVEARRLETTETFFQSTDEGNKSPALGLAGFLGGLAFERSGDRDRALRFYDDALSVASFPALRASVAPLVAASASGEGHTSKRLQEAAEGMAVPPLKDDEGEIVVVVGFGRTPEKRAKRVPIGLALTLYSDAISPANHAAANRLAAQGLVTWVNYPTLGPERGGWEIPEFRVDGHAVRLDEALDVSAAVREEWRKIEGKIVAAAITRMITRAAAGGIVGAVAGKKDSALGVLASLAVQGVGVALDKPDTRSWETLPARVAVQRLHITAGRHRLHFDARGVARDVTVDVEKGRLHVVSFLALR